MNFSGEWTEKIGLKVWKNLRLGINKYEQSIAQELRRDAEQGLFGWRDRVIAKIDTPLEKAAWSSKRDPSRDFPYLNTGVQVNSISVGSKLKATGAGNYSITSWAEIGVPYAHFTSLGFRKRDDGKTPRWVGWLDDVFRGTRGFHSVDYVFNLIALERKAFK